MIKGLQTYDGWTSQDSELRLFKEGWSLPSPFGTGFYRNDGTLEAGQSANIIDIGTGFAGFLCLCDGITLYTNQPVYLQIISNTYPSGDLTIMPRNPGFDWRGIVNGHMVIPARMLFAGQYQVRVNILEEVVDGEISITALKVSANLINPRRVTLSQFNRADKVIYWGGDSITGHTSVGTRKFLADNLHTYQVEKKINDVLALRNMSARTVNKAVGGQTSFDWTKYINERLVDIDQCDLFIFAYGTNEAINNVSTTDFNTYISATWDWFKRLYPRGHMVLLGATPLNNNTNETRLIALRQVMADFAEIAADGGISYLSMVDAFDRTVLSNYTSNDGVHPGTQATFDSMANIIYNHIRDTADACRALGLPAPVAEENPE